ncbi:MAG: FKBP-type peptidyl-prolyl cis-trans isomerase [Gemmatimonadales bacterium]
MLKKITPILVVAALACGGDDITGNPEDITFAPELGIDLATMTRTASGLYWKDIVLGQGTSVAAGATVTVHFTGWLPNGRVFDTTRSDAQPAVLDLDNTISGWQEGIPGMQVGGRRLLVIPPNLGFGPLGTPNGAVPGNMTTVFDVEVLDVDNSG